jgi:hypothetical protein
VARLQLVDLAEALGSLREDSKLHACLGVAKRVLESGQAAVVFTSQRDSARFVYDALIEHIADVWLFSAEHSEPQLQADAAAFTATGGVAVMTDAAVGTELARLDLDGIAFDLPRSQTRWGRRWTHIDRVGHVGEARMHALLPEPALQIELNGLRMVEGEPEETNSLRR